TGKDRSRSGIGRHDKMTRGAEQREGDERQQNRVEAGDNGRAGDAGVAENLRNVHRGQRQARESVLQRLARPERKKTAKNVESHRLASACRLLPALVLRIHFLRKALIWRSTFCQISEI